MFSNKIEPDNETLKASCIVNDQQSYWGKVDHNITRKTPKENAEPQELKMRIFFHDLWYHDKSHVVMSHFEIPMDDGEMRIKVSRDMHTPLVIHQEKANGIQKIWWGSR